MRRQRQMERGRSDEILLKARQVTTSAQQSLTPKAHLGGLKGALLSDFSHMLSGLYFPLRVTIPAPGGGGVG